MVQIRTVWLVLLAVTLVIGGCREKEPHQYRELLDSGFGIGVSFGMSQSQVQEVLGQPTITNDRQGGAAVEEYYLPDGVESLPKDPIFTSFTYHYEKLVRVGNKYFPDSKSREFPPYFVEALPGVKLGARRSAFVDALGPVEKSGTGETWRFKGADGEMITIKATFTDVSSVGDSQCSGLSVTYTPKVENQRGEAVKEKK